MLMKAWDSCGCDDLTDFPRRTAARHLLGGGDLNEKHKQSECG